MKTRVYLIRHGETAAPHLFHGAESDIGLSDRGSRQARALAPVMARLSPSAVVSSGMLRARLTAEPIAAACGTPLRVEPDLHERKVGPMAGEPVQANQGIWPETLQKWCAGDLDYAPTGMESFAAVRDRVLPVWKHLTTELAGRTVVIVAHGVVCKVLLLTVLDGWSVNDWTRLGAMRNAAVNEVEWVDGTWRPVRLNHLYSEVVAVDEVTNLLMS